jgi:hypothetical protein
LKAARKVLGKSLLDGWSNPRDDCFIPNRSRTGIIMGVVSILFFYRQRAGIVLRLGIFVGVVLAVILPFLSQDGQVGELLTRQRLTNSFQALIRVKVSG